jgi:predicted DNA-binding transcriptional regulator AlpA
MTEQTTVQAQYLRLPQAAAYLGMSQQFLRRAHREGRGPNRFRAGTKTIVFLRADLDAWVISQREVSGAKQ